MAVQGMPPGALRESCTSRWTTTRNRRIGLTRRHPASTLDAMTILTIVTADVDQARAPDLIAAYETLLAGGLPDGLLETQLLGDEGPTTP
jgi:hypothetical protein